jgi:hypothetical protein
MKALLRRNGGVNLRNPWGVCLAEIQTLAWVPLLLLITWCAWRLALLLWAAATAPGEAPAPQWREARHPGSYQQQHSAYGHGSRLL